ncbi:hypothetical protein IBX38_00400 [Candidatus Bathyarchaeota archaeon]|nr:hypothetical protein [Candidatus Bathyarchaeota archaeon]
MVDKRGKGAELGENQMGKITAKEAETKAMEFVKRRHPRVRRILIRTAERGGGRLAGRGGGLV